MARKSKSRGRGTEARSRATRLPQRARICEWVGGRVTPPVFVADRDEPYRPAFVFWLELPSEQIVGHDVVAPEEGDGVVGRALRRALEEPLVGHPRYPDVIRVADAAAAREVRAVVGDAVEIRVAPTPELAEIMKDMLSSMPPEDDDASYLGGGRVPPPAVAGLFAGANLLYRMAPWKVITDSQVLRMDIPALGVDGACLCVIGHAGEHPGLLLFPSLVGYETFLQAAGGDRGGSAADPGTEFRALYYLRGAELSDRQRREVVSHGWEVAGADAYPIVASYDRDGARRPVVERDVRILAAGATSFTALFGQHRELFELEEFEPVCESWFDGDNLEVRFTIPYEAFPMFRLERDHESLASRPSKPGRNDPCYCGSGRKYKQCHQSSDERGAVRRGEGHLLHDLDRRLVKSLTEFAAKRFGAAWHFAGDFVDAEATMQLSLAWGVYHFRVEGATVLDRYLESKGRRLSREERAWLSAQRASWLSVWEAIEVDRGKGIFFRDLLSGEERRVTETEASRAIVARDALLARVVDCEGVSLLCGVHPRALPPLPTADVVRRARARLRRVRDVPPERLRDERFGRLLIRYWEETVAAFDAAESAPRTLINMDGDAILLTTDHFDIVAGKTSEVKARLAALPGALAPDAGDPGAFEFVDPDNPGRESPGATVLGHTWVAARSLRVQTNSRERADALRKRIEDACGKLIRHRLRELVDPLSRKTRSVPADAEPGILLAEAEKIMNEMKDRHYRSWLDTAIPALGGVTPRAAVKTAHGRAAVDLLIKDFENREQRGVNGPPYDFSWLRGELGLE